LGDAIDSTVFGLSSGGLVPITPSSIAVGSGSASSAGNGQVTFTTVGTNLSLNGVFSALYTNYLILFQRSAVTASVAIRFRAGGTDNTSAAYDGTGFWVRQDGFTSYLAFTDHTSLNVTTDTFAYQYLSMEVFSPNVSAFTGLYYKNFDTTGVSNNYRTDLGGQLAATYVADGISFIPAGADTMTGTVSVYGYAK